MRYKKGIFESLGKPLKNRYIYNIFENLYVKLISTL